MGSSELDFISRSHDESSRHVLGQKGDDSFLASFSASSGRADSTISDSTSVDVDPLAQPIGMIRQTDPIAALD